MRIRVSRSGGFAGLTLCAVVDTDIRDDAAAWHDLAAAAEAPHPAPSAQARDMFVWTIEVDERRTVVGDTALAGALRSLAERTLHEGDSSGA